jgi:YidC/Oxa1 family membrane protein insertase
VRIARPRFLTERQAAQDFERQDASFRQVVFYSEGSGDWPHLGPIVEALLSGHEIPISYLTSDPSDPALSIDDPKLRTFDIGAGTVRTIVFARMDCREFVMTIPDLGNLWLKRSVHPVHYVYAFHSMNSTHTSYREGAFDNFDTLLCVGKHHYAEIRATEAAYGLPKKELVEHGSVKLDSVLDEVRRRPIGPRGDAPPTVLVAPTWGESSLIEQPLGDDVLTLLLSAGYRTVLRLHPMTVRRLPQRVSELRRRFGSDRRFSLEDNMNAVESWLQADVMVSDWSGAATEFAMALGRPVVYIDTPPKIMNPQWRRIPLLPFEASVRTKLGRVIDVGALELLPGTIAELSAPRPHTTGRNELIYNVGRSASVAAAYLASRPRRAMA